MVMGEKKITVCPFCGRTAISGPIDLEQAFKKLWVCCLSVNVLSIIAVMVSWALIGVQEASIVAAANMMMISASYFWFRWLLKRNA